MLSHSLLELASSANIKVTVAFTEKVNALVGTSSRNRSSCEGLGIHQTFERGLQAISKLFKGWMHVKF